MADIIHLLSDQVANQIAAGEVILRPGSAVKELLENAVDAGATTIDLIIRDAGRTLIQVVDNGCGMTETDARMSFERHATSKIHQADDLFAIHTLGFRGEALASIAAVAQVEMKTRRVEDELGTLIRIEGSKFKTQESCSTPPGSSIIVRNLFYNVPARRKFLKADTSELKHVLEEFYRVALVRPEIRFNYYQDNNLVYQLMAGGRKQRIMALFGQQYNERLVPVEQVTDAIAINGFIGRPEFARKSRGEQFFFVNGRYIRQAYLNHALENAYAELIPRDSIPSYFIYIDVDPKTIDVNIHPTKTEISFLDQKVVYAILKSSVRKALGIYNLTPSLDFDQEQSLDFSSIDKGKAIINPFNRPQSNFNPFDTKKDFPGAHGQPSKRLSPQNWESLIDLSGVSVPQKEQALFDETDDPGEKDNGIRANLFQVGNQFIVSSIKSGMVIIHQQRAHERVLYEQFLARLESRQPGSQQELFPQQVSFSLSDAGLIDELSDELNIVGFRLNKLGTNTFVITGTPSGQSEPDVGALLEQMLDHYKKNLTGLNIDRKLNLARSMASTMSVKTGQRLHPEEMSHLVDQLFSCQVSEWAPDGTKVFTTVTVDAMRKLLEKKES